jgi:hypothetical protein
MTLAINIYTAPLAKADLERERESSEKNHILKLCPVIAGIVSITYVLFEWSDPEKMSADIFSVAILGAILFTAYTGWRYWLHIRNAGLLVEAHPETTNAFLACANSSAVKAYCTSVKNQGRNLSIGEADELMNMCRSDEELRKIADYYDAHNLTHPEFAVH